MLCVLDGAAFTIDGNYILGREPEFDPAVVSGDARPLTLSDPENGVSRVHAELRLEGWRVLLADRGSSTARFSRAPVPTTGGSWNAVSPSNSYPVNTSGSATAARLRVTRAGAVTMQYLQLSVAAVVLLT